MADFAATSAGWLSRLAALVLLCAVAGCGGRSGSGTSLSVVSLDETPVRLASDFQTAIYRSRDANTATVLLSNLSLDDLLAGRLADGQVICLDMHWRPKAGSTPVDRTATNCTVRQVIFAGEALGVYDGAGFLAPSSKIGDRTFAGSLSGATIRLIRSSDGFADRLGRAEVSGTLSARRDDAAVNQIAVRLNTEATRRRGSLLYVLGY